MSKRKGLSQIFAVWKWQMIHNNNNPPSLIWALLFLPNALPYPPPSQHASFMFFFLFAIHFLLHYKPKQQAGMRQLTSPANPSTAGFSSTQSPVCLDALTSCLTHGRLEWPALSKACAETWTEVLLASRGRYTERIGGEVISLVRSKGSSLNGGLALEWPAS